VLFGFVLGFRFWPSGVVAAIEGIEFEIKVMNGFSTRNPCVSNQLVKGLSTLVVVGFCPND